MREILGFRAVVETAIFSTVFFPGRLELPTVLYVFSRQFSVQSTENRAISNETLHLQQWSHV